MKLCDLCVSEVKLFMFAFYHQQSAIDHQPKMNLGILSGFGSTVLFLPVTASTNAFLKASCEDLPDGVIVWADVQTNGRGRGANRWDSPAGKGLYFSLLLKKNRGEDMTPVYSLAAALAVKKGIEDYAAFMGLNPRFIDLKWPNDLLIAGKKIAGILLEGQSVNRIWHIIIGIGVNVTASPQDFSAAVAETAGSLEEFYGGEWQRKELLRYIALALEERLRSFKIKKTIEDFRAESRLINKKCVFFTGAEHLEGLIHNIGDKGELLVEVDGRLRAFISGTLRVEWK